MKYLIIIFPAVLILSLTLHTNVYAYTYFWGFRIPTKINEVKSTFSEFNNKYFGYKNSGEVSPKVDDKDLIKMEVSEKELNTLLSKYAKGKRYEQFTLEEIKVELIDNIIIADLVINQMDIHVRLMPIDFGKKLELLDIDTNDTGYLSGIKSSIIKVSFNAFQLKLISEYFKDFDSIKVETGMLTVFLKKQN